MKWTTKSLLALAGIALATLAWLALGQGRSTPGRTLAEAKRMLADEHFDEEAVLRRLEHALRVAEDEGEAEVAAEVLAVRGELLLRLGAAETARRDFERLLTLYRPGDAETRRLLVRTAEALGDYPGAVQQMSALLADQPEFGPAWVESGRLHERVAEMKVAQARDELGLVLVSTSAQRASELLNRLAAMDPLDPARATLAFELRELVRARDEGRLALALVLIDQASVELRRARSDYIKSFGFDLDAEAVEGLLRILVAAGELERAIDLGLVAQRRPAVAADTRPAEIVLRALLERGDHERAGALADGWLKRDQPLSIEFLHLCARALLLDENWQGLLRCDHRIAAIGDARDLELANLYRGLALAGTGAGEPAVRALKSWLRERPEEPWPGALAQVWRAIARAAGRAKDDLQEREALLETLRLDPEQDGQAWMRLAVLQASAPHSGPQVALRSLTHAMRLLPRRSALLESEFEKLGKRALEAEGKDLELVYQDLLQKGRILPLSSVGPYELLSLARMHMRRGNPFGTYTLARDLLAEYPGFLPALDLHIEALLALGKAGEAAELAVRRLEASGADERTRAHFDRLAAHPFDPQQVVRILRADPDHAGRRAVARHQRAQGDLSGALASLLDPSAELDPEERVLAIELLVEEGRDREALELAAQLPRRHPATRRALGSALRAAIRSGEREVVERTLEAIRSSSGPGLPTPLELGRTLLRLGEHEHALDLLRGLDKPRVTDGEGLLTIGLAALAADQLTAAATLFDRSEAFLPPERPALARMLLDARRGDWAAVERAARTLAPQLRLAPLGQAALALLAGDAPSAQELARAGLEAEPGAPLLRLIEVAAAFATPAEADPLAGLAPELGPAGAVQTRLFLVGSELEPRDRREALLWMIAAEDRWLAPYAAARMTRLGPAQCGELWPALLGARIALAVGEAADARLALSQGAERFPACSPLWDELERLERLRHGALDHPELLALRARRLAALGNARPESAEGLLLRARRAFDERRVETATRLVERALELRPAWPEAHALRAQALEANGLLGDALEAWRRACIDPPPGEARPFVPGFVRALALAERSGEPRRRPADTLADLERLAGRLPDDPRVVLALAELELRRDPASPAVCVARAFARLETFRTERRARTLSELAPGGAADWASFYATLDPKAARRFVETERLREPGNLELWILHGRVLREAGELEAAVEALRVASRMSADPRAHWELASALVARAADPRLVTAAIVRASELEGRPAGSPRARLLHAAAMLRQTSPGAWRTAAAELSSLWEERERMEAQERALTGELLTQALLLRDLPEDRQRSVEVAAETRKLLTNPYRAALVDALAGLGSYVPPARAAERRGVSGVLAAEASFQAARAPR